jgi:hypothetical protein
MVLGEFFGQLVVAWSPRWTNRRTTPASSISDRFRYAELCARSDWICRSSGSVTGPPARRRPDTIWRRPVVYRRSSFARRSVTARSSSVVAAIVTPSLPDLSLALGVSTCAVLTASPHSHRRGVVHDLFGHRDARRQHRSSTGIDPDGVTAVDESHAHGSVVLEDQLMVVAPKQSISRSVIRWSCMRSPALDDVAMEVVDARDAMILILITFASASRSRLEGPRCRPTSRIAPPMIGCP